MGWPLLCSGKVRAADYRDSLELVSRWAVRPDDLLQALLEVKPHVVHFSGHGRSAAELIVLDDRGSPKPVSKEALIHVFRTLKDNVRVVVLNACYSQPQAEALAQTIDCTGTGERLGVSSRVALVRELSGLASADFVGLVTSIEGAGAHVSRQGTVAELVRWAESPTGPGLAAIEDTAKELGLLLSAWHLRWAPASSLVPISPNSRYPRRP